MIKADAKIIEKNLRRLNEFNSTPEFGTTRVLFTETELAGREFVKGIMKDNGLEIFLENLQELILHLLRCGRGRILIQF